MLSPAPARSSFTVTAVFVVLPLVPLIYKAPRQQTKGPLLVLSSPLLSSPLPSSPLLVRCNFFSPAPPTAILTVLLPAAPAGIIPPPIDPDTPGPRAASLPMTLLLYTTLTKCNKNQKPSFSPRNKTSPSEVTKSQSVNTHFGGGRETKREKGRKEN